MIAWQEKTLPGRWTLVEGGTHHCHQCRTMFEGDAWKFFAGSTARVTLCVPCVGNVLDTGTA